MSRNRRDRVFFCGTACSETNSDDNHHRLTVKLWHVGWNVHSLNGEHATLEEMMAMHSARLQGPRGSRRPLCNHDPFLRLQYCQRQTRDAVGLACSSSTQTSSKLCPRRCEVDLLRGICLHNDKSDIYRLFTLIFLAACAWAVPQAEHKHACQTTSPLSIRRLR